MDQPNLIAKYATAGGCVVELTEHEAEIVAVCGGCPTRPKAFPFYPLRDGYRMYAFVSSQAADWAQAHAATCHVPPLTS